MYFNQFQQMFQNMNNNNNNIFNNQYNINTNQMMNFYNQLNNNPNIMNAMINNFNNYNAFNNYNMNMMNNNMNINQMLQMMMNANPMLFTILMQNIINNLNNNQNNYNNSTQYKDNGEMVNLFFITPNEYKIAIPSKPNEHLSSVLNRYINKSNDTNINYYIFNGQRLNESLTVRQQGLNDGASIYVVKVQDILGAF